MSCKRDYWSELGPEGENEDLGVDEFVSLAGHPTDFKTVLDELSELGDYLDLAEHTGQWMRIAEHAAHLRATCLEQGLGDRLTQRLVLTFLGSFSPRPDVHHDDA